MLDRRTVLVGCSAAAMLMAVGCGRETGGVLRRALTVAPVVHGGDRHIKLVSAVVTRPGYAEGGIHARHIYDRSDPPREVEPAYLTGPDLEGLRGIVTDAIEHDPTVGPPAGQRYVFEPRADETLPPPGFEYRTRLVDEGAGFVLRSVASSKVIPRPDGSEAVVLGLVPDDRETWAKLSAAQVGNTVVIVRDDEALAAWTINEALSGGEIVIPIGPWVDADGAAGPKLVRELIAPPL